MRPDRKEARRIYMSVEGKICETMYFKHLEDLINHSGRNAYNLKVSPVVSSPTEYAKRVSYKPVERKNRSCFPYFHVQDVEDYHDPVFRKKFFDMLDDMDNAKRMFHIEYQLGYSNYAFDLWMLLHVAENANYAVNDRHAYLSLINEYFHRNYSTMDDFKKENEFRKILDQFITLDSVFYAIENAKRMNEKNVESGNKLETYKKVKFYHDNPATSVNEVVQMILDICKVKIHK